METLVVWGEQDRLMSPAYAQRWMELLPNARLHVVPAAGHMLPYEQPEALARAIDEFAGESRTMAPPGVGSWRGRGL